MSQPQHVPRAVGKGRIARFPRRGRRTRQRAASPSVDVARLRRILEQLEEAIRTGRGGTAAKELARALRNSEADSVEKWVGEATKKLDLRPSRVFD